MRVIIISVGNTLAFFYETIGDHQHRGTGPHECPDLAESVLNHSLLDAECRLSRACYECQCRRGVCVGGIGSETIVSEKAPDVTLT